MQTPVEVSQETYIFGEIIQILLYKENNFVSEKVHFLYLYCILFTF